QPGPHALGGGEHRAAAAARRTRRRWRSGARACGAGRDRGQAGKAATHALGRPAAAHREADRGRGWPGPFRRPAGGQRGAPAGAVPAGLSARFPGLQVTSRQVINAQAQRLDAQNDLLNNLILGLIVLLAAAAVVNTLVMATAERQAALLLLRRVDATPRQLMSMTACQSALLSVIGVGLGIGAGATTLTAVARAFTGSWPHVPLAPALVIVGSVLALTMAATLVPTSVILAAGRRPTRLRRVISGRCWPPPARHR